jgi:hypothetical protein
VASDRVPIRRRRFQFSLATLLAGTAVAACAMFAVQWFALWRRAGATEHAFVAAEAKWDAGIGRFEEVRETSSRWLDAESALPFADERAAKIRYLARTSRLEGRIAGMLRTTMFTSREAFQKHEQWALQLLTERDTLEAELGLKVEDEN